MTGIFFNLGITRESRIDEFRAPLAPKHIQELKQLFPNIRITIQSSNKRCFCDVEYSKFGAIISEDLTSSDLILGVKEIDTNILIDNKKYLFFSHTSKIQANHSTTTQGTPGTDKKYLLK